MTRADIWTYAAPATAFVADLCFVAADSGHRWPMGPCFVAIVTVTAACSVGVSPLTFSLVAVLGWLFATGFLSHDYGVLVPLREGDAVRLVALLCVGATVAWVSGRATRRSGERATTDRRTERALATHG